MMVAAGRFPAITGAPLGMTINPQGAVPKEHCIKAPITTCCAIARLPNALDLGHCSTRVSGLLFP